MAFSPLPMRGPIPQPRPMQNVQQQQGGSIFGGLGNLFQDKEMLLALGAGIAGDTPVGNALQNMYTLKQGRRGKEEEQAKLNKTYKWLETNAPEQFAAVQAGVLSPYEGYKEAVTVKRPKTIDYQEVGGQLFNPENGQWISPPVNPNAPSKVDTSLNGVPMQDASGNWVIGQLNSRGELNPAKTPEGFKVASPYDKSAGMKEGELDGAARAALPGQKSLRDDIIKQIDVVVADPALDNAVGPIQGWLPSVTGASRQFDQRIQQLQGGAFLQARQMLKGGGQITDYEGQKAEQAIARLSQAVSEQDFKLALNDFKTAVDQGYAKLESYYGGRQAQQGGRQMPPQQMPPQQTPQMQGVEPSLGDLLNKY